LFFSFAKAIGERSERGFTKSNTLIYNARCMPIIKSAEKALRQSHKRRGENVKKTKALKTVIKNYKKLVLQGDTDKAKESLSSVYKSLDKAAKTNLIKKNKANRLKSRLGQRIAKSSKTSS
ncbi:MAG: 30S ribosomal protein S20, partial [Candidatus Colwellbacteria bacterium]|nr:30S ribosomal protein S20 [Candidatus Colwellbacteria bacterium]